MKLNRRCLWALLFALLASTALLTGARADTGVSDERLSLPDGPGSIGGVGQNASLEANTGMLSHAIPLELPEGFAGATPSLSLSYNSGAGNGVVGIGWGLELPHIERFSLRGLPRYDDSDVFAVDGSAELVRVSGPARVQVFRARFEGGFVRYTWQADVDGKAGYFVAEYPDGSRGFFGADSAGNTVDSARVKHPDGGVFRYLLVETLDRFGHSVRYAYQDHGGYPLLDEISYLYTGKTPRYRVRLAYEARSDAISSALAGFDLVLSERLHALSVFVHDTLLRRYELSYAETPAGTSQLTRVRQYGLKDELFPVVHTFGYSQATATCDDCSKPVIVQMGKLGAGGSGGVDLQNGRATLLDINGDALPDVLDTGANGAHRFFINQMTPSGAQSFLAPAISEQTRGGSAFTLSAPGVQLVDVNGDGFTDMIHTVANRVLCNRGLADWDAGADCAASVAIDGLTEDEEGDSDPLHMRFFDYDNDKRIDLLHTTADDQTVVLHNQLDGFVAVTIEPIGKMFDDSALQLGDINGDGLLDPVEIVGASSLSYRLNLGRGHWAPWVTRTLSGADETALADADLQDLNGDGLDDVVMVSGNTVKYALNRAGSFLPFATLRPGDVQGELPTRIDSTTVLFADMNASGTSDVVWITSSGEVTFLELFAVRPNLLTRIENGIGAVQLTEYGTSAREQARDEQAERAWRYRLPQAMNVVTATERYATLTPDVRNRVELRYHHGFYDGLEKRYRGFEQVEELEPAADTLDSQEPGLTVLDFDVGASDPYYAGRLLRQQVYGGAESARHVLQRTLEEYADCPLAEVPASGLRLPVRHVCSVASETLLQEDRPEGEWVTLRSERAYDGYGNVVLSAEHGVVGLGARGELACGACTAPEGSASGACGPECLGDEAFAETEYIAPGADTGGKWILNQPSRSIAYGVAGGAYSEQLFYYDGEPFVGLARGKLSLANLSRTCTRETSEAAPDCQGPGWVLSARASYDAHGNPVQTLDPLGTPGDESGHARRVEYDERGLKPVAVEILLSDGQGRPYRLRREMRYDPLFDQPSASGSWMVTGLGKLPGATGEVELAYDAFGRRAAIAKPGDTLDAPTSEFAYELADPVSRVVVRTRSVSGGALDLESVRCIDGFGRPVQERTRIGSGVYQVNGFSTYNRRDAQVRSYQPYQSSASACDRVAPEVPFTAFRYDGVGRATVVTLPDADEHGGVPSLARTLYIPLATIRLDPEDTDPASPAADTPVIERRDGLGRVIAIERYLGAQTQGGELARVSLLYDPLGRVVGSLDPAGHRKTQTFDLLGRVRTVDDPNAGLTRFAYDAAGNVLERTDARGATVAMAFDGANRLLARWDANDRKTTLVQYSYDLAGACKECTNVEGALVRVNYPLGDGEAPGSDEYGYDARGQTVFAARTLESHRLVTLTDYDNAGRAIATTHPDGRVVMRAFDGASRVASVPSVLNEVAYGERGELAAIRYANGTRSERTYDNELRLKTLSTIAPDGSVLQGFEYARDRAGNVWGIHDLSSRRAGQPSWETRFDYDAWYRVRSATTAPGSSGAETISLAYDLLDNVTEKRSSLGAKSQAQMGAYRYDARPNAVLSAGDLTLDYDAAGMMLRRGDNDLSWDYQGRLSKVSRSDGFESRFVYGADVERAMVLEGGGVTYYAGADFELRDGVSAVYVRLGDQRVARLASDALATFVLDDLARDGHITAADAWLAQGARAAHVARYLRASARRLLLDAGDDVVYLHADHLGSLTLATTTDGAVRGERAFDVSGEERFAAGHVDAHGFTGQERDEGSGLVHFEHRYLDTQLARWTSVDPLFSVSTSALMGKLGESTTGYAYVANKLANAVDSSGLYTLALGLWNDGELENFAEHHRAFTWWSRREKNKQPTSLRGAEAEASIKAMMGSAEEIVFSTAGFDLAQFAAFAEDLRNHPDTPHEQLRSYSVTNFELLTLVSDEKLRGKTRFYSGVDHDRDESRRDQHFERELDRIGSLMKSKLAKSKSFAFPKQKPQSASRARSKTKS